MRNTIKYIDSNIILKDFDLHERAGVKALTSHEENAVVSYFSDKIELMQSFSLGNYLWAIFDFADQRILRIGGMVQETMGTPQIIGADCHHRLISTNMLILFTFSVGLLIWNIFL